MNESRDLGVLHFVANADPVAQCILFALVAMSLVSWYLMASGTLMRILDARHDPGLLDSLGEQPTQAALESPPQRPSSAVVREFLACSAQALARYERLRRARRDDDPVSADVLTRDLDEAVATASARFESGLVALASIASAAPYVGLLGTVWGVYHALVAIGLSGQGTLDQVAGPVGEALIMTALGLAVAIPAVLGYNALNRANRAALARLSQVANRLLHAAVVRDIPASRRVTARDESRVLGAA